MVGEGMEIKPRNGLKKKLEKYSELAKEYFIRSLQSNETTILAFRVPVAVKSLYLVLPPESKKCIRQILIETINKFYEAEERQEKNINVNINVNMVKAEARAETNIVVDRKAIGELVEWLERILELESNSYPRGLRKAIQKALPEVKKLLTP